MPFCVNCGEKIDDDAKFCPACGTPAANREQHSGSGPSNSSPSISDSFTKLFEMKDTTSEYDAFDIRANKSIAIFAYFGILVIIPIAAAKNSKFAKFHVNQGLTLLVISMAYSISTSIINAFLKVIAPPLEYITSAIFPLLGLVFLALTIIGVVNAANGRAKELPTIGRLRLFK